MKDWFKKLKRALGAPSASSIPDGRDSGNEMAAGRAEEIHPPKADVGLPEAAAAPTEEPSLPASTTDGATRLQEAQRLLETNRPDEALELLSQVAAGSPEWGLAQFRRAWILAGRSRVDEALSAVSEAIQSGGEDAASLALQGNLLVRAGRTADAEPPLQRAALLGTRDRWAYLNLGYLLHRQERHEEALATIRKGMEARPDDATLVATLGRFLFAAGQLSEADAVLSAAAQKHASAPLVHVFRSWVLRARGDLAGAVASMRLAIEIDAGRADWHAHLASLLVAQERYADAESAVLQAARLDPTSDAIRELGQRVAQALGRQSERSPSPSC